MAFALLGMTLLDAGDLMSPKKKKEKVKSKRPNTSNDIQLTRSTKSEPAL